MKSDKTRLQAVLMLLITATLWSTSGLWIKVMSWSPLAMLGGRSFVAFFVLWAYLKKPDFRMTWLELLGSVSYVLTQVAFIWATKLTTAANAIFLQYASPIYVVIFGYLFLKEKPVKADWISMGMIFSGLFLFFGDKLSLNGFSGNMLAILSGLTFSVVMLVMRYQRENNPAKIIMVGNIIGFIIGFPFVLKETITLPNIGIILYLGIFQIGLSFVLYSVAIKHVRTLEANLICTLEPIMNPIWVFLVVGEKPGPMAISGSILVVAAICYRAFISARSPEDVPKLEISPSL